MPEYVVLSSLTVKPEETAPYREAHLNYLAGLKEEGKLTLAGRFKDGRGGLYILNVGSFDEAERVAEADPYHASGVRSFTVREWERRL